MDASIDQPQIGSITVDRGALSEHGTELASLLATLDLDVSTEALPHDTPPSGWRVLTRLEYAIVLGSPVDDGTRWWRIAQVSPPRDGSPARVQVHPEPQALRPSRAERSRGLALRWPEVTRSEPDFDQLAVDVVNTGDERWRPDRDSFMVIGFITRPGNELGVGYFGFVGGGPSPFALDPGDYARVVVHLDGGQWKDLDPGRHEISATLIDLGVRTESPLEVELTARRPQPPTPDRRPTLEVRLERLRRLKEEVERLEDEIEVEGAATDQG